MKDSRHIEEEQKLDQCLHRIDEIIGENKEWLRRGKDEVGVSGESASAVRRDKEQTILNLGEARPHPYFGRVDFVEDILPESIEAYYFGRYHIPIDYVYSWSVPAAKLFYQPLAGIYEAPSGKIIGAVKLKRELLIEQARLLEITDYRLLPPGLEPLPAEEIALSRELSKLKTGELEDIVVTIQPTQYEQIAETPQQVMIIQGVAGSGKSEVGLHRIAYLLSPYNELNLGILPERVVFVGPSRPFLRYISNLLPGLGVDRAKQTTLQEWLRGTLSRPIRLEARDSLFENLLSSSKKELEGEQKVAGSKGSLVMARIIDKYVRELHKCFISEATDLVYGKEVALNKARLRRIIKESGSGALNEQRQRVLQRIERELRDKSVIGLQEPLPTEVKLQFAQFWPELDYRESYIRLLSDRNALLTASKGSLTEHEVDLFNASLPAKSMAFKRADLPALCYIDHSLNDRVNVRKKGRAAPTFEHVVVDEAQDISPLEFLLLYHHSKNKSFTILGDIGQRLLPHRGITSWRDVQRVFSRESVRQWDAPISYRATYELTKYANRILRRIAPKLRRPIAYKRHGESPAFVRSKSYADMVAAIATDIRVLREQGFKTIAVLCKTSKEASRLYIKLRKVGIENATLLDRHWSDRAETVVASIYMTKGLEYDAVIVANARKNNYPSTDLHSRLLYIAVTRAAHRLHIHWFGSLAEILVIPRLLSRLKKTRTQGKRRTRKRREVR